MQVPIAELVEVYVIMAAEIHDRNHQLIYTYQLKCIVLYYSGLCLHM